MIEVQQNELITTVIVAPDRSSDWRGNQIILAVLGSICIGIALAFYFIMGVWIILPFAGLEVLALGAGLYYVSWKLSYQHHIIVTDETIRVEKGVYRPKGVWTSKKIDALLRINSPKHDWSPLQLSLDLNNENIAIGDFLGKDESIELASILSKHLQVRRVNE